MDENQARAFARERHGGQRFSGEPYDVHLAEAAAVLDRFGVDDPDIAVAVWLHDERGEADAMWEHLDRAVHEP